MEYAYNTNCDSKTCVIMKFKFKFDNPKTWLKLKMGILYV